MIHIKVPWGIWNSSSIMGREPIVTTLILIIENGAERVHIFFLGVAGLPRGVFCGSCWVKLVQAWSQRHVGWLLPVEVLPLVPILLRRVTWPLALHVLALYSVGVNAPWVRPLIARLVSLSSQSLILLAELVGETLLRLLGLGRVISSIPLTLCQVLLQELLLPRVNTISLP